MMKEIQSHFPDHLESYIFIDGFGGGGSAIFSKDQYGVEIYNDLNKNLYALFKVLQDSDLFLEFKKKCDLTPYSRDFRNEYKEKLKEEGLSLLDRAFMYFYVNRTSFNGVGSFNVNTSIRRKISKSVSDYLSTIDALPELHYRLSSVIIENMDILDLLNKYNNDKTFFYLDPPYVHSTRKSTARYEVEMSDAQHEQMIAVIIHHKGKFVISGYDNTIYNKLLEFGFQKKCFQSPHSDSVETLWWNT